MPKCEVGYVSYVDVRDRSSGVVVRDSAGPTHTDSSRLCRAFRTPRNVDMIVEIKPDEEPSAQPRSWKETELCPHKASEYRAAAGRLNYLALDRPDILFANKECSRMMSASRNGDWTAIRRFVRYLLGKPRLVWRFAWQETRSLSAPSATPIGQVAAIRGRAHRVHVPCTALT